MLRPQYLSLAVFPRWSLWVPNSGIPRCARRRRRMQRCEQHSSLRGMGDPLPLISPNYSLRLWGDLRGAGDRSAKVVGGTSEMGPSAPVGPKGLVEGPTPVFQQMAMCRRGLVSKNQTSWPSIHLSGVGGHVKLIRIHSDVVSPSPFNVIISYRSSVNVIQLYPVGRCDFKTRPRQTISTF